MNCTSRDSPGDQARAGHIGHGKLIEPGVIGGEILGLLEKGLGAPSPNGESPTTELTLGRPTKERPMERIPASERTREHLKALMEGKYPASIVGERRGACVGLCIVFIKS